MAVADGIIVPIIMIEMPISITSQRHRRLMAALSVCLIFAPAILLGQARVETIPKPTTRPTDWSPADAAKIDHLIDGAIKLGKCPGAVLLIGRGNSIVYEMAYGNRSLRPTTQPMTADTVFDLASLTKPLATATSIMLLSERGKLKLSDPVARYLPDFAQNGKAAITISDLLLHVGGLIPDDDLSDYANGPAVAVQKILAAPPTQLPEARFAYTDVGYIVLGEIVRKVDGRSLDAFSHDEIFTPLKMRDTGYLPDDGLKSRCAPTERRDGHWMIGEVHDPRAHALGDVAGHAGVFSTAEDLSRFCRMILAGGTLDGIRVLKSSTVTEMIHPRPVPGPAGGLRAYGFDIDTAYSSPRGDGFPRGTSFGHTGFTGTCFWIDPIHDCYFILLANSVHPDGKGNVKQLRHDVATAVAEGLLGKENADGRGGNSR